MFHLVDIFDSNSSIVSHSPKPQWGSLVYTLIQFVLMFYSEVQWNDVVSSENIAIQPTSHLISAIMSSPNSDKCTWNKLTLDTAQSIGWQRESLSHEKKSYSSDGTLNLIPSKFVLFPARVPHLITATTLSSVSSVFVSCYAYSSHETTCPFEMRANTNSRLY